MPPSAGTLVNELTCTIVLPLLLLFKPVQLELSVKLTMGETSPDDDELAVAVAVDTDDEADSNGMVISFLQRGEPAAFEAAAAATAFATAVAAVLGVEPWQMRVELQVVRVSVILRAVSVSFTST